MGPGRRKTIALFYGVLCHGLFALGVGAMLVNLFGGLRWGFGPFTGSAAVLADSALILQFPLLHSWLMTPRGRRLLAGLAPGALAADLATTLFAMVASLQMIAVFAFWSPIGTASWRASGLGWPLSIAVYALAWIVLLKALYDARMSIQTGFLGWSSVFRGVRPDYGPLPTHGLFRFVRQPVYIAFALVLWTAPVWTLDRLALAGAWSVYCVLGPRLKERRYLRRFGDEFRTYQQQVPYMLPALGRRRASTRPAAASPATPASR